jgi:hypothetical protein
MKKTPAALAVLLLCAAALGAEGSDSALSVLSPTEEFPSSIGIFGSSMLGGGLSWQHWAGSLGCAVTAGGMARLQTENYGGTAAPVADFYTWGYNVELDLMYRLFSSHSWNWLAGDLFVYAQVGHRGERPTVSDQGDVDGNPDTMDDSWWKNEPGPFTAHYSVGVGVGYEIVLFRHFSLPIYFGYAVEYPLALNFNLGGGLRYRY